MIWNFCGLNYPGICRWSWRLVGPRGRSPVRPTHTCLGYFDPPQVLPYLGLWVDRLRSRGVGRLYQDSLCVLAPGSGSEEPGDPSPEVGSGRTGEPTPVSAGRGRPVKVVPRNLGVRTGYSNKGTKSTPLTPHRSTPLKRVSLVHLPVTVLHESCGSGGGPACVSTDGGRGRPSVSAGPLRAPGSVGSPSRDGLRRTKRVT